MKYYRNLILPHQPLKNRKLFLEANKERNNFGDHYSLVSQDVLTDEVLDLLLSTGLEIDFVVIFKTYDKFGTPNFRLIHSDVTWDHGWKNLSFGVHYEIGDDNNNVKFQWYNMDEYEHIYPIPQSSGTLAKLNGIHFIDRFKLGVPDKAILLDEVLIKGPMLVCTDVPHLVLFTGARRMSLSIRFKNLISYDSAIKVFQPLICGTGRGTRTHQLTG